MISKNSRYAGNVLFRGKPDTLGIRSQLEIPQQPGDRFHVLREGERIDILAFKYLGDAQLWWIIADVNKLFFPLEIPVGTELRIPPYDYVQMRIVP